MIPKANITQNSLKTQFHAVLIVKLKIMLLADKTEMLTAAILLAMLALSVYTCMSDSLSFSASSPLSAEERYFFS